MQELTVEALREFVTDQDALTWIHRNTPGQHNLAHSGECWCRPLALTWEEVHICRPAELQSRLDGFQSPS